MNALFPWAQMSSRAASVAACRTAGRGVVAACGAPLACDVQDQLELLNERWHAAAATIQKLNDKLVPLLYRALYFCSFFCDGHYSMIWLLKSHI